jgi:hypothetical protein
MQFYCSGQCYALGAVALLAPFAILYAPGFSLGIFLYLLATIGASKLYLPDALLSYSMVWLDYPFMAIACYLPFSILGGLGAAGLLGRLEVRAWLRNLAAALLLLLVVWNAAMIDSFSPDSCCNYAHTADLEAIHWIGANVPQDAYVAISTYPVYWGLMGMDAGIWVTPLTGRRSLMEEYGYNWDSSASLREVCSAGDVYVYVGDRYFSFQKDRLIKPDWYELVFESEETDVFHILSCIGGK